MTSHITGLIAILAYCLVAGLKLRSIRSGQALPALQLNALLLPAVALHALTTYLNVVTEQGIHLGFFRVSALIFLLIILFSIIAQLRNRAIDNLTVVLYPMAALAIGFALWAPSPYTPRSDWSTGLASHVIFSIIAYGVLTIASLQAVALAIQENALKKHRTLKLINILPPLQTMEELLFDMLWLGFILLSASIASGYLFVEDLFAQHLVHKTVFSITAWLVFATLLWGRHQQGWRGKTAVRWTLVGFAALMLAYFGSKFVLELLLHKG